MTEQADALGPIGYLVVEFPKLKITGEGMSRLIELVDRGLIRILDLAFAIKDEAGNVRAVELRDLDGDGEFDLAIFEGASSGLLDPDDVEQGGAILQPGSAAAILLYENRWAAPFAAAIRKSGGEVVAAGFVPVADILASLDDMDARQN